MVVWSTLLLVGDFFGAAHHWIVEIIVLLALAIEGARFLWWVWKR
jgi:hypothetical protein